MIDRRFTSMMKRIRMNAITVVVVAFAMLAAGCSSMPAPASACIEQSPGTKICSIVDRTIGLTTRTVERGGKLFVSTCQMANCTPFEELPSSQK